MTLHNLRLLDLYTDYLLSSFGASTATGLARLLPKISHDQITRFLSQQRLSDHALWKRIKKQVRAIESPQAVLIIDDTVEVNSSPGTTIPPRAVSSKASTCSRRST
jgi:hypothetical protein